MGRTWEASGDVGVWEGVRRSGVSAEALCMIGDAFNPVHVFGKLVDTVNW